MSGSRVHVAPLGVAGRARVAGIQGRSVTELEQGLASALDVVHALKEIALPSNDQERCDAELGLTPGRCVSRIDGLLSDIETQFGWQRQQQRKADVGVATARERLAPIRRVGPEISPSLGDFVKDFLRLPSASRPAGSVALDVECDMHSGRLIRFWMCRQAQGVTFGGEGRKGAWAVDSSGRGAVLVTCPRQSCRRSVRLTNDWLVARLKQVRADFEAGKALPIAWYRLSQVGVSSR